MGDSNLKCHRFFGDVLVSVLERRGVQYGSDSDVLDDVQLVTSNLFHLLVDMPTKLVPETSGQLGICESQTAPWGDSQGTLANFLEWIALGFIFETDLIQMLLIHFWDPLEYRIECAKCLNDAGSLMGAGG